ncbi:MAG: Cbb3-type cytochrome oxidase component FixQ [Pseudomonadota bacterium]|jgi:cytochrome c oxidase cbb3-type subunit 4
MLSGIITTILLILFVVGSIWVFSPKRQAAFDEAALLALDDTPEKPL